MPTRKLRWPGPYVPLHYLTGQLSSTGRGSTSPGPSLFLCVDFLVGPGLVFRHPPDTSSALLFAPIPLLTVLGEDVFFGCLRRGYEHSAVYGYFLAVVEGCDRYEPTLL